MTGHTLKLILFYLQQGLDTVCGMSFEVVLTLPLMLTASLTTDSSPESMNLLRVLLLKNGFH